jgi:myosin-5
MVISGAGKTVSAKYIMRYFATADDKESSGKKKKADTGGMTEVEEQILGRQLSLHIVFPVLFY